MPPRIGASLPTDRGAVVMDPLLTAIFERHSLSGWLGIEVMEKRTGGGPKARNDRSGGGSIGASTHVRNTPNSRKYRITDSTESNPPTTPLAPFGLVEFGQNLRRLRQEQQLTQEMLAESANVSPRYVALIEAGARNPTLHVVLELAAGLRVPPHKLFKPAV